MHLLKGIVAGIIAAGGTFTGYSVDQQWHWIYVPIAVSAALVAFNATYFTPYSPEPVPAVAAAPTPAPVVSA